MNLKGGGLSKALAVLIAIMFLVTPSLAFFRHLCHGQLGIGRIDPLKAPGKAAQHVHNIQGAQNFGFDVEINHLMASNCTSCSIRQDKSVYWSPQMYFRHDNGTFEIVPTQGGLTVYYFTEKPMAGGKAVSLQAFPTDFRMIAGMAGKRAFFGKNPTPEMSYWTDDDRTQMSLMEKSIGFNCMEPQNRPPEDALKRLELPDRTLIDTCRAGIRAELQFPSCWNGVDRDSDDHTSHVAYPYMLRSGDCPEGYPARLPTLFFETIFSTQVFAGMPGQFVFAQGDVTGYGYHGDFINGWDSGVQEQFIESCSGEGSGLQEDCPVLDIKNDDEIMSCKMEIPESLQSEAISLVDQLPGGCQIVTGVDWSNDCGKPQDQGATASTVTTGYLLSAGGANISTPTSVIPSGTTNFSQSAATTYAAAPPDTTPAPTSAAQSQGELTTYMSTTIVNNTVVNYLIVEEIVITTVFVEEASPTPGATPGGVTKRHIHVHRGTSGKGTAHAHGGEKSRKVRDKKRKLG